MSHSHLDSVETDCVGDMDGQLPKIISSILQEIIDDNSFIEVNEKSGTFLVKQTSRKVYLIHVNLRKYQLLITY